jgi:hypothetical protein
MSATRSAAIQAGQRLPARARESLRSESATGRAHVEATRTVVHQSAPPLGEAEATGATPGPAGGFPASCNAVTVPPRPLLPIGTDRLAEFAAWGG